MHDERTVVTERGQTSIPASLRELMKLRRGTKLAWERVSESEMRVRVLSPKRTANPEAMIGFGAHLPAAESTEKYMKRMREGE